MIDLISTHATGTQQGDVAEIKAIQSVFVNAPLPFLNNTKSLIGHAMGASGALELAGNLPSLKDNIIHPTINLQNLDARCEISKIVRNQPIEVKKCKFLLNNSLGMLGINTSLLMTHY